MAVYLETAEGDFTEGGRTIPNDLGNRDYQTMQAEVLALESTITPYAASALELAAAISAKQQEVREHYEGLHGEALASVAKRQAAASPSVVTTANAITNIAIADGGIAAIAALIDKATVDAYSVVGLAWS